MIFSIFTGRVGAVAPWIIDKRSRVRIPCNAKCKKAKICTFCLDLQRTTRTSRQRLSVTDTHRQAPSGALSSRFRPLGGTTKTPGTSRKGSNRKIWS